MTKHYLITGAGRGIGRGLSRLLLNKGHRVFLVDNNVEELNNTAQSLSKNHRRGTVFEIQECNLCNPQEISSAASAAGKFFNGRLDCLVNNAACTSTCRYLFRPHDTAGVGGDSLATLPLEVWTTSLETNLTAPMLMSQACLPLLRKSTPRDSSGCIIHISSTRAIMSEPNNEPYSATKAGLLGLSQSMAVSLADDGIRSNAILPGWINVTNECLEGDRTGMKWEDGLSEDDQRWHLTGRVGRVEDMLRAVEYLADSEFVSGEELIVDGGVTRKMIYPE